MAYEAVIFDLGGVVVECETDQLLYWISSLSHRPLDEVQEIVYDPALLGAFELGRISPEAFYDGLLQRLPFPWTYSQFVRAWNSILKEHAPVTTLMQQLHSRYRLMALSNTNVLHLEYMTSTISSLSVFEKIVASCEVGLRKPDPQIYQLALEQSALRPDQAVYIDDRVEFVKAGHSVGLTTVHCEKSEQLILDLQAVGLIF